MMYRDVSSAEAWLTPTHRCDANACFKIAMPNFTSKKFQEPLQESLVRNRPLLSRGKRKEREKVIIHVGAMSLPKRLEPSMCTDVITHCSA
ncbi:hypothetical protein QG37_02152 [Candidozyma auris]|nr:hypothetical protein QG37_02152 [[Candida] auris]